MLTHYISQKRKYSKERAQALVEFAIVLPILMLLLIGIFEVGRMVFVYSAVNNASREAVRFGSAIGYDDTGMIKYKNCAEIRNTARRSAYFLNLTDAAITITYDHGPGTAVFHTCTGTVDPGYFVQSKDRIIVQVTGQYRPYTLLMPFGARSFVSRSARTILGFVTLEANTALPTVPTSTLNTTAIVLSYTPTETATSTPTETPTNTPQSQGPGATLTAFYITPSSPTPADTPTLVPTATPVDTLTPTPTATPTVTGTLTDTPTPTDIPTTTP